MAKMSLTLVASRKNATLTVLASGRNATLYVGGQYEEEWWSTCHPYSQLKKIICVMLLTLPSGVSPGPTFKWEVNKIQLKESLMTCGGTLQFHKTLVENGCCIVFLFKGE